MQAKLTGLIFSAVLLAGCGNQGDLYLPEPIPETSEEVEQENEAEGE
jgi:predicted small lipoprotein YifL